MENLNPRYFVPDLSPMDRSELRKMNPKWVFVAESPHLNEIESETRGERRPLCGAAGKQWWSLLTEIFEGKASADVSLSHMIRFCLKHRVVILNAVQHPLDSKIEAKYPLASPVRNLGFTKTPGPKTYKKLKEGKDVKSAISRLEQRLNSSLLKNAPIYCLGNDAEWFVHRALKDTLEAIRIGVKIPHPSAWWRRGGYFGRVARERLTEILQ